MQFLRTSICLLASLALFGCGEIQREETFATKELTARDIISIYEIDIQKQPAEKFEWDFKTPKYIRCVLEKSNDSGKTWTIQETIGGGVVDDRRTRKGIFVFTIMPVRKTEGSHYIINIRLGGRNGNREFWRGSAFFVPVNFDRSFTALNRNCPEDLLQIQSSAGHYRMRLERSDSDFVE